MLRKSLQRKSRKVSRKSSRKVSRKSTKKSLCKKRLSEKIAINMREYKTGRYKSRGQAIAVSYSQIKKSFPRCKKELSTSGRKSSVRKTRKSSHRKARFGFIDSICKDSIENNPAQDAFNEYLFGSRLNGKKHYTPDDLVNDTYSEITINGIEFLFDTKIAEGSYGKVFKLTSQKPELAKDLAIKFCEDDEETLIAEALNNNLQPCDCLRVRSVGTKLYLELNELIELDEDDETDYEDYYGYFMELCDGTLEDYLTKIEYIDRRMYNDEKYCAEKILEIVEKIRKQMVCIYETNNNYVYTDLKMANVLYKCRGENDLAFLVGDLGGAVANEDGNYKATYPPFEYGRNQGVFKLKNEEEKDKAMAWELGVLLLLCNYMCNSDKERYKHFSYEKLIWTNGENFNQGYSYLYFDMIRKILKDLYGEDISDLLNTDPKSRRSVFLPLM